MQIYTIYLNLQKYCKRYIIYRHKRQVFSSFYCHLILVINFSRVLILSFTTLHNGNSVSLLRTYNYKT